MMLPSDHIRSVCSFLPGNNPNKSGCSPGIVMLNHKHAPIFGSDAEWLGKQLRHARSWLGAGDSNENVFPWSNGSLHAIVAGSCMDVASCSQKSVSTRGLHRAEQVFSTRRHSESIARPGSGTNLECPDGEGANGPRAMFVVRAASSAWRI